MPTEHKHITYSFDELSEEAKETAVKETSNKLAGDWWDQNDIDDLSDTMLGTLSEQLKTPGWEESPDGSCLAALGVKHTEWDLDRRTYKVSGCLTPTTAPALPWPTDATQWGSSRDFHGWKLYVSEDDGYEDTADESRPDVIAFRDAWDKALGAALNAGQTEYDYKTGEVYAREWLEGNGGTFNEDGTQH